MKFPKKFSWQMLTPDLWQNYAYKRYMNKSWCHLFRNKARGTRINCTVVVGDPLLEQTGTLGQDEIVIY